MEHFFIALSPWWQVVLGLIGLVVFGLSLHHCRRGKFYSDTFWLTPLGIFVWGDGLILAPFWVVSSLLFLVASPMMVLRYVLIFFSCRSAYEVIYWINHQVAQREYDPPLFRRYRWLTAQDGAILYQLLNMCQLVLCLGLLMASFAGR